MAIDQKRALGGRLKALRKQRKMSQEQLASLAEISTQYVSNIERGKENPTLDLLLKLAGALRVSLPQVFDFDDEGLDRKAIQTEIRRQLDTLDVERLRIAMKVLKGIMS